MSKQTWIFLLLLVACKNQGSDSKVDLNVDADIKGINACREHYVSAWMTGNADSITSIYTNGAMVLYPNQAAIPGRDSIFAYFKTFFAEFLQAEFDLTSEEIKIAGEWAFDRGKYKWKGIQREKGDTLADEGKYLVILQKQGNGEWKVARDMDNSNQPLSQMGRGLAGSSK